MRLERYQGTIGGSFWERESERGRKTMQLGFLTASRYQRAFVDFFEDQLVARQYNLQGLLDEYLLGGREPLINGIISGRPYKST